jgi:DNA-entry nuclease
MKYHTPDCSSAIEMKAKNKKVYTGSEKKLEVEGYSPCKNCNP